MRPPWRASGSGHRDTDPGSVTAELALALPTLVVILTVGLYALAAVSVQGRCATAAAAGARAVARGESPTVVRAHVLEGLPRGSSAEVGRADPALLTVRVTAPLPVPAGLAGLVHGRSLSATARASDEAAEPETP
jgi:hypothetical protein